METCCAIALVVAIEAIGRPNLVRSAFSPLENKLVKRFPIAIAL